MINEPRVFLPKSTAQKGELLCDLLHASGRVWKLSMCAFATSCGIACLSAPEGNAFSVAEQALAAHAFMDEQYDFC